MSESRESSAPELTSAKPLWEPSADQIAQSNISKYIKWLSESRSLNFANWDELYAWSVKHNVDFWQSIWELSKIRHSTPYNSVLTNSNMPGARWFEGARLNFAENLLRYRDERTAIIFQDETGRSGRLTYAELYRSVATCAARLRRLGVKRDDRVAAFLPNGPEAVIGMLAVTSLGAIWSSCSPDFGLEGVLNRFEQIAPKILFATNGYSYHGKIFRTMETVDKLRERISSIERVIVVAGLDEPVPGDDQHLPYEQFISEPSDEILFEPTEFDQPVYIMYSSGTTGTPKGIVHGAGGTLLQHFKEHHLHANLTRDDVLFYFTTCGWMMWNWLVSGLQIGATIVLYDGSPVWPEKKRMWDMTDELGITVFGTSPRFLSVCEQEGLFPSRDNKLTSLKSILSTGAPLSAENFSYVYNKVKPEVQLSSISGGTDIISCFMLGNPILPVYSEQIQCRGLGMAVEVFNDRGKSVVNEVGELVCTKPFPSMPVKFWNDPDGTKYRDAYFDFFPDVWRHGDYIKLTPEGGLIVYGRSDATLNPGGVRIGTSEIYGPVEGLSEIADSIVVAQSWKHDSRIVLFVVLADGGRLNSELKERIRGTIREKASPRHLPAVIAQVDDIPRTLNGKKVELAVHKAIHGEEVTNLAALANPNSLDQFRNRPELNQ